MRYVDKRVERQPFDLPSTRDNVTQFPSMLPSTELVDECRNVLENIRNFTCQYVNMTDAQATVVSLWVVHTHLIHLSQCTPYLAVTSKTKRSGKTRLLETVELLVNDPLRTANITEAALFRAMSERTRTLLLDEVDTIFGDGKSRELLRAILNASYRRGSPVYRTKGKGVEGFDVFSPKMIAGIGDLPDTVEDRSIPIRLTRSTPTKRFRLAEVSLVASELKSSIDIFKEESILRAVYDARPVLPEHLHDRQQDSWEPLVQLGVICGWLDEVYQAATDLYTQGNPWEEGVK